MAAMATAEPLADGTEPIDGSTFVTDASERRYGAQSMTAPLLEALVHRPAAAFGAAFDNPAHGYLHAAVYTFDPLLITDDGAIPLRPGKANRSGEPAVLEKWTKAAGIPTLGRIDAPGTIEGGDTFWLRPDLLCIGRSLRTNEAGARQLAALVSGEVRLFDLPYWRGDAELVHLLSVISPVSDELVVIYPPLLPAGLWALLAELGIRTLAVPDDEFSTLGCNVLAVRPGVLVMADGNPRTRRALETAGCEVHVYPASEIGINGSGGPTCMTQPILRA